MQLAFILLAPALAATLGQLIGPDTAAVPDLPPPPFYEDWLLVNPLPLAIALGALCVLLGLIFVQRGKARRGLASALVGIVTGALVLLAGAAVTTPREIMIEHTSRLVQATASGEAEVMRELLHADVVLKPGPVKFIPNLGGRDRIIGIAADRLPRAVDRVVVLETRGGLDGASVGRTQVRLRTFGPGGQLYGHSWWGLDWQEYEGRWIVVGIEPLWIQGAG